MSKRIISDLEILSGTPVFHGTRIPLDHVAGLIQKGVPDSELAEDFPALNQEDFDYARAHATQLVLPSEPPRPLKFRRSSQAA
jgi:uncharacterized protein (DUF433 family)